MLAEALSGLLPLVAKHVQLEELVVAVATDEVDSTGAELSEHNDWFFNPVEAFHESVRPSCC